MKRTARVRGSSIFPREVPCMSSHPSPSTGVLRGTSVPQRTLYWPTSSPAISSSRRIRMRPGVICLVLPAQRAQPVLRAASSGIVRDLPSACIAQRFYASAAGTEPATEEDRRAPEAGAQSTEAETRLIYEGPKKGILRGLKLFSLTTCLASFAGTPVLIMLGNPDIPLIGRSALGLTALFFGTSTTALLNHLTKGYVTKAYLAPATDAADNQKQKLVLHTYTLLTRTRVEEVDLDDIKQPSTIMPYVTFHSERNNKNYCLEYTAFEDEDLWNRLFPFAPGGEPISHLE